MAHGLCFILLLLSNLSLLTHSAFYGDDYSDVDQQFIEEISRESSRNASPPSQHRSGYQSVDRPATAPRPLNQNYQPRQPQAQLPQQQQPHNLYSTSNSLPDLSCNFRTPCTWMTGNGAWMTASSVILDAWHSVPRSRNGGDDLFAYAQGGNLRRSLQTDTAILRSPTIMCDRARKSGSQLTLWYWKTSNLPIVDICIIQGSDITCFDKLVGVHEARWIQRTIYMDTSTQPFQIMIRATLRHVFDIVGIDDISFVGDGCRIARRTAAQNSGGNLNLTFASLKPTTTNSTTNRVKRSPLLITDEHTYQLSASSPQVVHTTTTTTSTTTAPTTTTTTPTTTTRQWATNRGLLDIDPSLLDAYAESQKWRRYVAPTTATTTAKPRVSLGPPAWIKDVGIWARELAPLGKVALELGQQVVINSKRTIPSEDIFIPTDDLFGTPSDYGQAADDVFGAGELADSGQNPNVRRGLQIDPNDAALPRLPFDLIDSQLRMAEQLGRPVRAYQSRTVPANQFYGAQPIQPMAAVSAINVYNSGYRGPENLPPLPQIPQNPPISKTARTRIANNNVRKPPQDRSFPTPPLLNSRGAPPVNHKSTFTNRRQQSTNRSRRPVGNRSRPAQRPRVQSQPAARSPGLLILPPGGRRVCPAINCAMDSGTTCSYSNPGRLPIPSDKTASKWKLADTLVANSLTGISGDATGRGMFAYAGGTRSQPIEMYTMSSRSFYIRRKSRLEFSFYQAGIEGRLRVCIDSMANCPFVSDGRELNVDARIWRSGALRLPKGKYTIHFVVDRMKRNYVIGLDEIALREHRSDRLAPCSYKSN